MTKPGAHLRSAAAPLARGGAEGRRGADAALPERMGATLVRRSIAAVLVACAALTAGGLQRPPRPQPRPRAQLPSSAPPPLSRRTALLGSFATAAGGAVLQPGRARGADDIGGLVWTPVEGSVRKLSGDTQRQRFPLRFSTYLTRFLLEYDRSTRAWWDEGGRSIPLWFDEDAVERVRLTQYGELTRSVEYGLATAYDDPDGADRLLAVLSADFRSVAQARQLAILFSLLPAGDQPVRRLGELLGRADNASVRAVRVREPGRGYDPLDPPNVTISSPLALNGSRALGRALVDETNGTIVGVELLDGGSGYSQARRVTATVDPPPRGADSRRALLEVELPAREERRGVRPSRLPALSKASSLTSLLPDRTPVTYDEGARCYRVGRAGAVAQIEEITPPDGDVDAFGPVNREPVQRSAAVDGSQYARLALAGAVCAALGHAALTPLEVVKTKLQADAARYDGLNFFESVAEVAREPLPVELARTAEEAEPGGAAEPGGDEGPPDALHDDARAAAPAQAAGAPAPAGSAALEPAEPTLRSVCENLFRGVDASALGHFISGGISFGLTEYLRRALAEALGPESALIYPPWAVVSSASVLGVIAGTTAIAPFEATRVRMVTKPGFAPDVFAGLTRLSAEDGLGSAWGPKFRTLLLKDIPFAMLKFSAFDAVSAAVYALFPSLAESLQTSLLVSLASGFASGVAAAAFSHPADTIFTQLSVQKKAAEGEAQPSLLDVARRIVDELGVRALYAGVGARCVFSGLLLSIEFLIYDYLRAAMHVGTEDLQLYLDVLAGLGRSTGGS